MVAWSARGGYASLRGSDVCVMAAAYPNVALVMRGAVGWRASVCAIRGRQGAEQVEVFGSWLALRNARYIQPVSS